ncbi:MAG: glucosaminidase domain-containing protein [Dehalobacterium sp.]
MSEAKIFIDSIKSYALANQKKVGVPAAIIIAQACLETGYGKYVCKDMDSGMDSKNLFNIKGTGPAGFVTVWTTEYIKGIATKVKAKFRAYNDYRESFEDHSRLMLTERYKPCMAVKEDPEEFARQLQKCRYATDPKYADKLIYIMKTYGLLNLKQEEVEEKMVRYGILKTFQVVSKILLKS